jgi:hypothetical protein
VLSRYIDVISGQSFFTCDPFPQESESYSPAPSLGNGTRTPRSGRNPTPCRTQVHSARTALLRRQVLLCNMLFIRGLASDHGPSPDSAADIVNVTSLPHRALAVQSYLVARGRRYRQNPTRFVPRLQSDGT